MDRKRFFQAFWKNNKLAAFLCLLTFFKLSAQNEQPFVQKHAHAIRIVCLLELLFVTGNDTVQTALLEQAHPTKLIKNFVHEYGSYALVTFFHELGHALAAKIINNNPIAVHLGSNDPAAKPLISLPGISIDGLQPNQGYSEYSRFAVHKTAITQKFTDLLLAHCKKHALQLTNLSQEQRSKLGHEIAASSDFMDFMNTIEQKNRRKTAAIMLAGSALGITAHVTVKTLATIITNTLQYKNSTAMHALKKALEPDTIMLHQLLNMVIPFQTEAEHESDGKTLLKCCAVSPSIIEGLQTLAPVIDRLIDVGMSFKDSSAKIEGHSKLLLGLLNHELRGFLRLQF